MGDLVHLPQAAPRCACGWIAPYTVNVEIAVDQVTIVVYTKKSFMTATFACPMCGKGQFRVRQMVNR